MTRAGRERAALLILLAVGLTLRFYRLGVDSLWYDETVSGYLAGSPVPELLRHTAGDIHPPGYYLLLRGWLILMGFPDGRAAPTGIGLEWAAGFFSVFFGVTLIALAYILARRLAGARAALIAAGLVALSPFNVQYSQEVRMYTLGAALGALAIYALYRAVSAGGFWWWAVYALTAATGMYTLYYFVFLLVPLNLWVVWEALRKRLDRKTLAGWITANFAALLLYLPWLPNAIRQATDPPVPPWRQPTPPLTALTEGWQALSLGQSAPVWTIPIALVVLGVFVWGLARTRPRARLWLVTLGPPALILIVSALMTPLYHVRYLFTFSPAVYVAMASGEAHLWRRQRVVATVVALAWLVGAGATLHAFWTAPEFRADDHRGAVRALYEQWRPGDAALVNAGYAYTTLATYWPGEIAERVRLTESLPDPRADDALLMLTTGHVDGAPDLGWGDPRSDFFAMPAETARAQIAAAFAKYPRLWHYRIYDTVSDPDGVVRSLLDEHGGMVEDRVFAGEANMRLQAFTPREGAPWVPARPEAAYKNGLKVQWLEPATQATAGDRLYGELMWLPQKPVADIATSLRLVGSDGTIWAQPPDERPLGPLYPSSAWPVGQAQRQPIALEIPPGTPPGAYSVKLVTYDPATGQPLALASGEQEITLGEVDVIQPESSAALGPGIAQFGPLRILEAGTPATRVSGSDQMPVEILWQAVESPGEPLVVVLQLLDATGNVVAGIEEEPLQGRYPTQHWEAGEMVRDRHVLDIPAGLTDGVYHLVVGVYQAADRARIEGKWGLLSGGPAFEIKEIEVRAGG